MTIGVYAARVMKGYLIAKIAWASAIRSVSMSVKSAAGVRIPLVATGWAGIPLEGGPARSAGAEQKSGAARPTSSGAEQTPLTSRFAAAEKSRAGLGTVAAGRAAVPMALWTEPRSGAEQKSGAASRTGSGAGQIPLISRFAAAQKAAAGGRTIAAGRAGVPLAANRAQRLEAERKPAVARPANSGAEQTPLISRFAIAAKAAARVLARSALELPPQGEGLDEAIAARRVSASR
jgi:hypothetical protein